MQIKNLQIFIWKTIELKTYDIARSTQMRLLCYRGFSYRFPRG